MNHTVSARDYFNLRFNGTLVGETGIHAALCGTWDCPILLVTGVWVPALVAAAALAWLARPRRTPA